MSMARPAKTFKGVYPQLFRHLSIIAIFYSMRGDFKIAAVILAAPLFAFLRPFFLYIVKSARLALINLLFVFFYFYNHIIEPTI